MLPQKPANSPKVATIFTLQRRVIMMLVASIGLTVSAGLYAATDSVWKEATTSDLRHAKALGNLLAKNIAGAMQSGRPDAIERSLADAFEAGGAELTAAKAFSAAGTVLHSAGDDTGIADALAEAAEQALASGEQAVDTANHVIAVPLRSEPGGGVIGTLAFSRSVEAAREAVRTTASSEIVMTSAIGLVLAIAAYFYLRSVLFRPLDQLSTCVSRILAGERVPLPMTDRRDELGALARSLSAIQTKVDEMATMRAALENTSSAMIIVDTDLTITYANPAMFQTLSTLESYWQERIPGFTVESIVGRNFDIFGIDPSNQGEMVSGLAESHSTELRIGDRIAALNVTPIIDDGGTRMGAMIQWTDRTEQNAAEEQVADLLGGIASGDFSARLDITMENDFLKLVANGVNSLAIDVETFLGEMQRVFSEMARGNLRVTFNEHFPGQLGTIADQVGDAVGSLDRLVTEVKQAAAAITQTGNDVASGSSELSSRAETQAASIEQTSAAMEEMSATVRENAENASKASDLANGATEQAERGRSVVADTVRAMGDIRDSAKQINEILQVIDAIASQTNLLALNAAVEAARAGEAGKGFAVVASEVGRLAQRSSEAAKNIKTLIDQSGQHVAEGDRLVEATDTALSDILSSVRSAAETMGGIAHACAEQANGVEEINSAIGEMDTMTQQVATLAEESQGTAQSLEGRARSLSALVMTFSTRADGEQGSADAHPDDDATADYAEALADQALMATPSKSLSRLAKTT
ncbi:MAG: methyl-accepting chemotaxis protein [Pseudomonadota bacterium]